MLRPAGTLPLLLLLLASAGGQQPDCNLAQPDTLSGCVKSVLESLLSDVHQSFDPLHLDRKEGCRVSRGRVCHNISDIVIHGLSTYTIDHVDISFPEETSLAVRATFSWPALLEGSCHARLEAEGRICIKKIKASESADAEISVDYADGELDVTIRLDVDESGAVTATLASTSVTVWIGEVDVYVDVRPGGFIGLVDRLIGKPPSKIVELVVVSYWMDEWRSKVKRQAKEMLERAIVEKLGERLSKLLHV